MSLIFSFPSKKQTVICQNCQICSKQLFAGMKTLAYLEKNCIFAFGSDRGKNRKGKADGRFPRLRFLMCYAFVYQYVIPRYSDKGNA